MPGKLIIFCAPSGSGKTTIVQHLIRKYPTLGFSISACTRPIRSGKEEYGKDYYFLSETEFQVKIDSGEFVEWEEVYAGNRYGTLKEEVIRLWDLGQDVIFDVDVEGGLRLKKYYGEKALAIFVKAPSFEVIENRLRTRGTEDQSSLTKRLDKVRKELEYESKFDEVLVNDQLEEALLRAENLVENFLNYA